jgi:amino acid transporter
MASAAESGTTPQRQLQQRAVGLPTAIGTTFGLIVATTVMASVASGFFASYVFLAAIGIALLAMYLQSMSFSELATMIPKAGSMNEYVRPALGPFFATLTVLVGYFAIVLFPGSAEAYAPSVVVHDFLGATFIGVTGWVAVFLLFVGLVNAAGIQPYGAVEVTLTVIVSVSLFIFGIIGLGGWGTNPPIGPALPHVPFTWSLLSTLLGVAIFTFVGMEYTCPLAEELKDPARNIPLGIFLGLALVSVPVILFGLAAARYVPADQLSNFSPVAQMDVAIAELGNGGKWWIGLVSVAATLSTLNAVTAGVPRIFYGMALTRQLPSAFAYLLPRARTPIVGICVAVVAPILMNVFINLGTSAHFIELILAGVLGWATAYVVIHASVAVLRFRYPREPRPFRSPLFPIPQLVGSGLLALAAYKIYPDPTVRSNIYRDYGIFIAVAIAFSFLYNAFAQRSATSQFRPVALQEVYRETAVIEHELPPQTEPTVHPHLPHPHGHEPG